jgi:myo-inositol-hexaphosphate 3-phosphohydrolase
MSNFCGAHRVPRAGERIDSARAALEVVALAMRQPPVEETLVLVLDEDRRGRAVVHVDDTTDPDAVVVVVERLSRSMAASGMLGALVVATVRPGGVPLLDDDDRWIEASELADEVGVELVEWFVIAGRSVWSDTWCPRDLLGEVPRWSRW